MKEIAVLQNASVLEMAVNRMSNADFIRNMTNEELSEFICHNTNCQTCQFLTFGGCTLEEWLGKEHEDDD